MLRTSLLVALAVMLGACASARNQRHAYTGVVPAIAVSSPGPVALAVHANPRAYGLVPPRIAIGAPANLVLLDENASWQVTERGFRSRSVNS